MTYRNSGYGGNKPVTQFSSANKCTKFAVWKDRKKTDDFTATLQLRYYDKKEGSFVDKKSLFPGEWEDLALCCLAMIKWRADYLGLELPPRILDFMKYGFSVVGEPDSSPEVAIANKMNEGIDRANRQPKKPVEAQEIDYDDDDIPF